MAVSGDFFDPVVILANGGMRMSLESAGRITSTGNINTTYVARGDKARSKTENSSDVSVNDSVVLSGKGDTGPKASIPQREASVKTQAPAVEEKNIPAPKNTITEKPEIFEGGTLIKNANGSLTTIQETAEIGKTGAPGQKTIDRVFDYIKDSWQTLTRNATDVASLTDSKAGTSIIYVPPQDFENVKAKMAGKPGVDVQVVNPGAGFEDFESHGLLYLPNDYVVPGGRFNEMYGWDSYFTVLGLVQSNETKLASDMVNNMFYQVDNYGKILNANRSYYLDRSSPPFQSSSVLAVYEKTGDKEFLREGIDHVVKEYNYWTNPHNGKEEDHLTPTGLSRYYSPVGLPCPEVEEGYYESHNLPSDDPQFCQHDRAERESGWDMTGRFEYRCADHNPVDLNSYLYKFEKDLAKMHRILEGKDSPDAQKWDRKAAERKELINKYCWNEEKGMFVDYDFKNGKKSDYNSLATFIPLWAGIADERQAALVMKNLDKFEMEHGLSTSDNVSNQQWDHPSGWAPLHIMAAKGMRNYGFNQDADRVSTKFMETIINNFDENGGILEKYNVEKGTGEVNVGYGNQVGFGWTNAAFLELYKDMSLSAKNKLRVSTK